MKARLDGEKTTVSLETPKVEKKSGASSKKKIAKTAKIAKDELVAKTPKAKVEKSKSSAAEKKKNERAGHAPKAGAFGVHPSALEVPGEVSAKKKSPAERLDELRAAHVLFHERLDESGHMEGTELWTSALDALREAGIEPKMNTGAEWNSKLEGEAAYAHKVEWYLGQLLALAIELEGKRPSRHLYEAQQLAPQLRELEGGRDLRQLWVGRPNA